MFRVVDELGETDSETQKKKQNGAHMILTTNHTKERNTVSCAPHLPEFPQNMLSGGGGFCLLKPKRLSPGHCHHVLGAVGCDRGDQLAPRRAEPGRGESYSLIESTHWRAKVEGGGGGMMLTPCGMGRVTGLPRYRHLRR